MTISGPSTVEVGIPYNYTFTFNPVYPNVNGVQADTYIITTWIVLTGTNGQSNAIPGYINTPSNQSSYYNDGTYDNANPITIPIQWGDGTYVSSDNVTVKVSGIYRFSGTGENIGYFDYLTKIQPVSVERLVAPVIVGPSPLPGCNQTNQTYSITNNTNSTQKQWQVTGASIIGSSTGSSVIVKPNLTGNFTVICTVKRSSANPNYSVTNSKTVSRIPFTTNATITGNTTFCTSSTFTIDGLLTGQTVLWSLSASPPIVNLSSTTGTTTTVTNGNKSGDFILTAKITNACGEFVNITKTLSLGTQFLSAVLTTPSGNPYSYPYYNVPENCSTPLYVFKTSSENTNLNSATKQMKFTYNGTTITKQPVGSYYFFLYASDFNISAGNDFTVSVKVGNNCGFSTISKTFLLRRPTPCECGIGSGCPQLPRMSNVENLDNIENELISITEDFKIYPNPSNEQINIELNDKSKNESSKEVAIYNIFGILVEKSKFQGYKTNINVSRYAKGVYLLRINYDGKIETHQIVIE